MRKLHVRFGDALLIGAVSAVMVWAGFFVVQHFRSEPERITLRLLRQLTEYSFRYKELHGHFPSQQTWDRDILQQWGIHTPHCARMYFDGWQQKFRYVQPGRHNPEYFDIYSVGRNGIDELGGGDDMGNWVGSRGEYDHLWTTIEERYLQDKRPQQ